MNLVILRIKICYKRSNGRKRLWLIYSSMTRHSEEYEGRVEAKDNEILVDEQSIKVISEKDPFQCSHGKI